MKKYVIHYLNDNCREYRNIRYGNKESFENK